MSDQGQWWKLWCSALDDDALDNLPIADFGRYCKLGAHIKKHGTTGTITLRPPCKTLLSMLQLDTFDALIGLVSLLPNVRHTLTSQPPVTLTVTYNNWKRFQEDTSAARTRKWRERKHSPPSHPETAIEEKRREEKRTEEKRLPPQGGEAGGVISWPESLRDVQEYLQSVRLGDRFDPDYWQKQETWIESTGLAVYPLTELKAYLAHQATQNGHKKHRDLKRGFRAWLANAVRWKERDETRTQATEHHRPRRS